MSRRFFAVFGQMPYLREWDRRADRAGFLFKSHICWVKRNTSPYGAELKRTHEDIFIYAKDRACKFFTVEGRYEDVKTPGILFDIITIEGIKRYIAALREEAATGKKSIKRKSLTGNHVNKYSGRFDTLRCKETAGFTDVWSFLPESLKTFNKGEKFHPTMKPLLLEQRLIELLTPENGSVLDCFSGSGTTAIACKRLNRQFLCIEKEREFYEYSVERLNGDVYQAELPVNNN